MARTRGACKNVRKGNMEKTKLKKNPSLPNIHLIIPPNHTQNHCLQSEEKGCHPNKSPGSEVCNNIDDSGIVTDDVAYEVYAENSMGDMAERVQPISDNKEYSIKCNTKTELINRCSACCGTIYKDGDNMSEKYFEINMGGEFNSNLKLLCDNCGVLWDRFLKEHKILNEKSNCSLYNAFDDKINCFSDYRKFKRGDKQTRRSNSFSS